MKPIETKYKGYRFRSRLEARWAVFFDTLGIEWEYEPEGYIIGLAHDRYYLPDFYLPKTETWVEIKGNLESFDWDTVVDAIDFCEGLPKTCDSIGTTRGLLLLGNIPEASHASPAHVIFQYREGVEMGTAYFGWDGLRVKKGSLGFFDPDDYDAVRRAVAYLKNEKRAPSHYDVVDAAYKAARSARFEHGENG